MKRFIFLSLILCFGTFWLAHSLNKFANVSMKEYDTRANLLVVPQTPMLPDIVLLLTHNSVSIFRVEKPISIKEKLYSVD